MATKILERRQVDELVALAKANPLHSAGIFVAAIVLIIFASVKLHERHERIVASDITRGIDLVQIQENIEKYFLDHDQLPASLSDLAGGGRPNPDFIRDDYLFDPETRRLYEYDILTLRSYNLCTDFHYSYTKQESAEPPGVDQNPIWLHGAGHGCFKAFVTRDPKAG